MKCTCTFIDYVCNVHKQKHNARQTIDIDVQKRLFQIKRSLVPKYFKNNQFLMPWALLILLIGIQELLNLDFDFHNIYLSFMSRFQWPGNYRGVHERVREMSSLLCVALYTLSIYPSSHKYPRRHLQNLFREFPCRKGPRSKRMYPLWQKRDFFVNLGGK